MNRWPQCPLLPISMLDWLLITVAMVKLTLICDSFDEELGAIGFVEEFIALLDTPDQLALGADGLREYSHLYDDGVNVCENARNKM